MKKILLLGLIILFFWIGTKKVTGEEYTIPDEAIRLRVIANSNSEIDQEVKFKVTENVENVIYDLLKNTKGIEEARKVLNNNIDLIDNKIATLLEQEKYPLSYEIKYGLNYFPKKEYKGVTYEEGYYESLVVTLGEGKGNNWWCVLFPPLCLMEAEETNKNEVEYKFFIQELIEKYL
jgi:stage II sporulation protein R